MGTYYALGIVKEFTATSDRPYSEEEWKCYLNEKMDISLFDFSVESENKSVKGILKDGIFKNNIQDFYSKLIEIIGENYVNYYFELYGTEINNYPIDKIKLNFKVESNEKINIIFSHALLFIEGKVLVETFSIEPKLMSWLFRHCDIGNCLSGCVISGITR